jgi:hypothetical protein
MRTANMTLTTSVPISNAKKLALTTFSILI